MSEDCLKIVLIILFSFHVWFETDGNKRSFVYGYIYDFITINITITSNREGGQQIAKIFTENLVLLEQFEKQPEDARTGLPMINRSKLTKDGIIVAAVTDIAAAVNYASIYDISHDEGDREKFVVITEKSMI